MANLDAIDSKNIQPLPLDTNKRTKPLASAEKIRMGEPVPGTSDNDAESWRARHEEQTGALRTDIPVATPARAGKARVVNPAGDGYTDTDLATLAEALDNAVTLAELQAKTRDIHASDYPGTWETADDAKIVVTTAVPPQLRAVAPSAASWASATAQFTQAIPGNLRNTLIYLQLPVGASPSNYRLVRVSTGDNGARQTGTIDSSRWSGLSSSLTGDYPAGLYQEAFDGDLGTHWNQIVWTLQKHSEEVHKTEYKGIFDGTFSERVLAAIASAESLAALRALVNQNAAELAALDTIVTGDFELMTQEDVDAGYSASFANFDAHTEFESPSTPPGERFTSARQTNAAIRVPKGTDPNVVRAVHRRGGTDFITDPGTLVDSWPSGDIFWARFTPPDGGGSLYDFYQLFNPGALPHFNHRVSVLADDYIVLEIRAAAHRVADDHSEARFRTLEDRTSHVAFDNETPASEWAAADNTPVGGKEPYGKWAWIFRGSLVDSYKGHDYDGTDDFYDASGDPELNAAGFGLLWVLPNNINWSHVRLVVRRSDGSVKSTIVAQGLRNVPSTITVSNLPDSPPDVTVRWSSHDDTHPFATTNFETGDTVALEALPATHIPVWEGELSEEVTDLLTETQAYLDSLDEIRFEANPASLVISSVPSEFDAGSGVTTDATDDIAAEHPLVESLVRSIRHGYDRPLRVAGNLKFYFQRAQPQTTSGAILQMRVSLRVRGKGLSKSLLTEDNTIQEFTDAQTAYGNFNYPPLNSPSKEFDIDELVDLSDWTTLEDDDEIQFHLEGGGVNAQARVRLDFDDMTLSFDHANIRGVPDLPEDNERDGKALKFSGHELGWHPALNVSTILANSVGASIGNNLNALRWEPHTNALGTANAVGTADSGRTLTLDGRLVAKSNTFGIIVRIERGTPIRVASEVFIPWSQFRTGSGTYVTNAVGAIRQGIFAGFWDDSRANSVIFATCTMHESNGQLQLQVGGAYGDGSSRMTIHLAR